jgi:chemotaxis protein methyltransferase CheR
MGSDLIKMSDNDYQKISQFICSNYGIKLPLSKKTLLESRLQKRLKIRRLPDFKAYINYLFTPLGTAEELVPMVDAVTTNKTDFFRGPDHFEFIATDALPELSQRKVNSLRVWSAGCSSGQEPYTTAIVLSEYKAAHSGFDFSILGTDLSMDILKKAVNAVYSEEQIRDIPHAYKVKYFLKGRNPVDQVVRIVPTLRDKVTFDQLNLMMESYPVPGKFHIIFCRNVLIYFDRATQESVINKLAAKLEKGGYLFIGHSESLTQMDVPLKQIRPTIFQKV